MSETNIDNTLEQRGNNYGNFKGQALVSQNIKAAMHNSLNWGNLPPEMKEALEMMAHKTARILNGDPNFHDSWHHIIGYVRLIEKILVKD